MNNITNINKMFEGCSSLKNLNISNFITNKGSSRIICSSSYLSSIFSNNLYKKNMNNYSLIISF